MNLGERMPLPERERIAKRIAHLLRISDLSMAQIGRNLNVSESYIRDINAKYKVREYYTRASFRLL